MDEDLEDQRKERRRKIWLASACVLSLICVLLIIFLIP